ncbi:type VII secretion system-associated protein [Streptomyces sp. V2I9]|uniref:type VII secretion system-associated protein n=1 Tax=Streptomyces sp. V2I9 TaxID=3042304 RepID=UPI00278A76CF|nr:type VII secretion system-associated protein [Streptomyces sp. V2I9]MDQ0988458.1 hypothetical protein [Streptomyces sp. V2I9]
MADRTFFDVKKLESFRDTEVTTAHKAADTYRNHEDKGGIRPLSQLIDKRTTPQNLNKTQQILRLGNMLTSDLVSAQTLVANITTAGTAIDKLLGDQITLFREMKEALQDTVDKMKKTNQDNLNAIDAQALLQLFSEVDEAIVAKPGGNTTTTSSTT